MSMPENTYYGICTNPEKISSVINGLNSWSNPSPNNIKEALEQIYYKKGDWMTKTIKDRYSPETVIKQWIEFLNI